MNRVILIVMDGCGAGEAPDAARFGDADHPATLRHVWESAKRIKAPTLIDLGLFAACGVGPSPRGIAGFSSQYGRLRPLSEGKDSVTGHWEMMGIVTEVPFPTYPQGFPADLISAFEKEIGRKVLGNYPASGTVIIQDLGDEHMKTGKPIVYTSADSVFQIAAHEEVIPVEDLYQMCLAARKVCVAPNNVERVIARPFTGSTGRYERTGNRRDFPLEPPRNLVDDIADAQGMPVEGVGVVPELFNHRNFADHPRSRNNKEHFEALKARLSSKSRFIFANFEDFDMLYGHRNNPAGFADALEQFDLILADILSRIGPEDEVMITADHGNDPTTLSTDHSREYSPWLVIRRSDHAQVEARADQDGLNSIAAAIRVDLGIP